MVFFFVIVLAVFTYQVELTTIGTITILVKKPPYNGIINPIAFPIQYNNIMLPSVQQQKPLISGSKLPFAKLMQ